MAKRKPHHLHTVALKAPQGLQGFLHRSRHAQQLKYCGWVSAGYVLSTRDILILGPEVAWIGTIAKAMLCLSRAVII